MSFKHLLPDPVFLVLLYVFSGRVNGVPHFSKHYSRSSPFLLLNDYMIFEDLFSLPVGAQTSYCSLWSGVLIRESLASGFLYLMRHCLQTFDSSDIISIGSLEKFMMPALMTWSAGIAI